MYHKNEVHHSYFKLPQIVIISMSYLLFQRVHRNRGYGSIGQCPPLPPRIHLLSLCSAPLRQFESKTDLKTGLFSMCWCSNYVGHKNPLALGRIPLWEDLSKTPSYAVPLVISLLMVNSLVPCAPPDGLYLWVCNVCWAALTFWSLLYKRF